MTEFRAEQNTGTMEVLDRHSFDIGALEAWMRERVDGFKGPLAVEEFRGGQSNPTFKLSSPSGEYVMRRKPPGKLLKSAHAVDREYRVMTALAETPVPVPRTYGLCEDEPVIGAMFYVMEFLDGRVVWDGWAGDWSPQQRGAIWDAANAAVAELHKVDFRQVGLEDFGKHSDYIARQITRWSGQYEYTRTEENPYMDNLIEYLPRHIPDDSLCNVVHGDLQIANMMMAADRFEVVGILDWELSTLGNPLSDFAYMCRPYRSELRNADLAALGIPEEQEYVEAYCRRVGIAGIPDWDFYMAFNMFRLAGILQGIAKRVQDGTAASEHAAQTGAGAFDMAKLAWAQIDKSVRID